MDIGNVPLAHWEKSVRKSDVLFATAVALAVAGVLVPTVTFVFVLVGTAFAFTRGKVSGTFSVIGIALYFAAWPALASWGQWGSLMLTCVGVLMWFTTLLVALHQSVGSFQQAVRI
ncbi:MAG: hypothetical protein WC657_05765 [Candidatus Paceibacterota bacterium]|jgi:hypothetical protein